MKHQDFDVVVIGGGHAGSDAAHAAARCGVKVALLTLRADGIGVMSCNPAIGGLGQGPSCTRDRRAGGAMGRVADASGIQFRLLNRRKGPAVQGPRTQSDRKLYRQAMQRALRSLPNLTIIEGEAADFTMNGAHVTGIRLADGSRFGPAPLC